MLNLNYMSDFGMPELSGLATAYFFASFFGGILISYIYLYLQYTVLYNIQKISRKHNENYYTVIILSRLLNKMKLH